MTTDLKVTGNELTMPPPCQYLVEYDCAALGLYSSLDAFVSERDHLMVKLQ